MAQVKYRHQGARPAPDELPHSLGGRSRRNENHKCATLRSKRVKSNRCIPLLDSRRYRCVVDWMREEGDTVCRHFIHDVLIWSRCGHFAAGDCLCGRAQSEARNALLAVGFPVTLNQLQAKWVGPR